jgi:hypothetical protein
MTINVICEVTKKDSDVGMRVAENSRINMRELAETGHSSVEKTISDAKIHRVQELSCKGKCLADVQLVKTFERGEIVVSMDGELLLVALAPQGVGAKDASARDEPSLGSGAGRESTSTLEDEKELSLGSIEEPDVLECWEAEVTGLAPTPRKALQGESADDDSSSAAAKNDGSDRMEHVQRYYRLQADSGESGASAEEDTCDNTDNALNDNTGAPVAVPNMSDRTSPPSTCCVGETVTILPKEEMVNFADKNNSKLPIEEAFEVYESFYTGKPLLFASMDSKLGKSRLFGRDKEGPVPCKAVCCIIQ